MVYGLSARGQAHAIKRRQPLRFEAAEKALHRGIFPTVSSAAHALYYAVSPKHAWETQACILASLTRMKHQTLRVATAFQGLLQGLHYKLGIELLTDHGANDTPVDEIGNHGQVAPTIYCPDVGHIAAPPPVRRGNVELTVKETGNIHSGPTMILVRYRPRLHRPQTGLAHEATNLEAPTGNPASLS